MRIGRFVSLPDQNTDFAQIKDKNGGVYTVAPKQLPEKISAEKDYAFKVDLWENDSGLAYDIKEE